VGIPEGKRSFGELRRDERIILKRKLKKEDVMVSTGFTWLGSYSVQWLVLVDVVKNLHAP
jgi:hypothetical protein